MTSLTRELAPPARRAPHLGALAVRIRGGGLDGRVVRLRSPKCTVGSGPRCTLRLLGKGVRPLHCLIVRADRGTFVRRWSPDTQLNGCPFEDAVLNAGDRLTVGPLDLEVLPGGEEFAVGDPFGAPTSVPAISSDLPGLEADSSDSGASVEPARTALADARTAEALRERIAMQRKRARGLIEALRAIRDQNSAPTSPAAEATGEPLRDRLATHRQRARRLVEALRASRQREQELTSEITANLALKQQAEEQVGRLMAEADDAAQRTRAVEARVEELEQESARLNEKYDSARQELQSLREAGEQNAPSSEADSPRPDEGQSSEDELQARIRELSAELDAHKERERALIMQLKLSKERQSTLRQRIQEASSDHAQQSSEMEARIAEFERERQEIAELRREFQEERNRLAAERAAWERGQSQVPASDEDLDQAVSPQVSGDNAEAAIAHLRELSLWSDDAGGEEAEAPSEPHASAASGSPVSFLEKYAPQLLQKDPPDAAAPPLTERDLPGKSDEDESLGDYMAKLMQRVRGDEPPAAAASRKSTSEKTGAASHPRTPAPSATPDKTAAEAAPQKSGEGAPGSAQPEPFRLQDIKRTGALPERRSNFAAMRELANLSAHSAISDYRARRVVRDAVTTLISGGICLGTGIAALYLAAELRSAATVGGAAGLLLAGYFFIRGILNVGSILREGRRPAKKKPTKRASKPEPAGETTEAATVTGTQAEQQIADEPAP